MSQSYTIVAQYALADVNMLSFKQISDTAFNEIIRGMRIVNEAAAIQIPYTDTRVEAIKRSTEIRNRANEYEKQYIIAQNRVRDFEIKHHDILSRGKFIRQDGSAWQNIFSNLSHEQQFERYKQRHAPIYEELKRLVTEQLKYDEYSPAHKSYTEYMKIRRMKEELNNQQIQRRNEAYDQKHGKEAEGMNLINRHALMFGWLIKDLKITINGTVCEVTGLRKTLRIGPANSPYGSPLLFSRFNQTFINQLVTFSR